MFGKALPRRVLQCVQRQRRRRARHHIADQPLAAARFGVARHHGCLRHAGLRQQHRGDLARFDAEAADLDLLVGAPEVLQHPRSQPAAEVSGTVHPLPRRTIRVGDEVGLDNPGRLR